MTTISPPNVPAKQLLDDYLQRTGISSKKGNPNRRYLWTDAYAVKSMLSLNKNNNNQCIENVIKLVDGVHYVLGKFRKDDHRQGWISGLPEEEGREHPTFRGLRIGKHMPERQPDEPFDQQLEWERDGQYFHYNSQWVFALIQVYYETSEKKYLDQAAELIKACEKFIYCNAEPAGMFWKMSTDLTHPLVRSMGAHDPLEGLIACESIMVTDEKKASLLEDLRNQFAYLCQSKSWSTIDPLGLGILLANVKQSATIMKQKEELPASMHPRKLLDESIYGLESFSSHFNNAIDANQRLAFRECGLSHGLRVLWKNRDSVSQFVPEIDALDRYMHLVDAIEDFWSQQENRQGPTWTDHLDINAVMLAASLAEKT